MTEIQLFDNGEFELHVTRVGDSFQVAAPSLARALGFASARDLIRSIPDGEKGWEVAPTPGGDQRIWHLREPGFFRALGKRQAARIRDEEVRNSVERFQDWVFGEVLPAIRRTGGYSVNVAPLTIEGDFSIPHTLTWDEVCALMRQRYGIAMTVNETTRMLRTAGVLKQNGSPRKEFQHLFWYTGSAWTVHPHVLPELAQRVWTVGRELQDSRFIQVRLELEGVGRPPIPRQVGRD